MQKEISFGSCMKCVWTCEWKTVTCLQLNPKALSQAKISLRQICKTVSGKQSKLTQVFLLECASRSWSLSSSTTPSHGAALLGVSCWASKPSVPQPSGAFPGWLTAAPTPAPFSPAIAGHRARATADAADWGYRLLRSWVSPARLLPKLGPHLPLSSD